MSRRDLPRPAVGEPEDARSSSQPGTSPSWQDEVRACGFPAVVATDLDGTLLRSDGTVSEYTRGVLERYLAAGGEHVMVTARPPRWLTGVAHMVPPGGVILAGNGAFVVEAASCVVMQTHGFETAAALELVTVLRDRFPQLVLGVETAAGMVREASFPTDEADLSGEVVPDLAGWLAQERGIVGKLLGRCSTIPSDDLYPMVGEVVGSSAELAYSGAVGLLEITAAEVTKARALTWWCHERGYSSEQVWAFGDMPNDLPMLRWAGRSFAPANAHPQVAEIATAVIPHHDQDGVAQAVALSLGE